MDTAVAAPTSVTQAPPFPEGWFRVAFSDDVAAGQVVPLRYFGRELVMFRTMSGVVQVLTAHCIHLGAHLGVGGKVEGENLCCPFHGWQYGTDGLCKKIPYSPHIPKAAFVGHWPTVERSGLVLVWYSPAGRAPQWDAPALKEYGDPAWTVYLVRQRYAIHTTVQEIVENVPDTTHFQFVHGNADGAAPPETKVTFDGHMMRAQIEHNLPSYGATNNFLVELHGVGLALSWSESRGTKAFWTTYTPIDAATAEVYFVMLAAKSTPRDPTGALSRESLDVTLREFEKDIPIWENKIYRATPLVVPGDGPIGRYRSWVRQFHPV